MSKLSKRAIAHKILDDWIDGKICQNEYLYGASHEILNLGSLKYAMEDARREESKRKFAVHTGCQRKLGKEDVKKLIRLLESMRDE